MPATAGAPPPARVDVAVIGGGITGLSAAIGLARSGARVAVLDSQSIGWGASSRNGGMVLTGLKLGAGTLIARYGKELARELFAASLAAVDAVDNLVRLENIDCQFERRGHLELASKPAHFRHFEQSAEMLSRDFSHEVRLIPRGSLRDEIGSGIFHGGLLDQASGSINPARYVAGLARVATASGATLHGRTAVTGLERQAPGWRLTTERGVVEAGETLVATSGYTGPVTRSLRRKIVPIGSYIIATEILPEALASEVSPRGRMLYDSLRFLHYFRLTPDRRMLFGGRARFVPETEATVLASAALLRKSMLLIYPQLRDVRTEYAWGGTLDFAFDTMPHLGQADGYHYALGYAGHGVALATLLGRQAAQAIASGGAASGPFARIPFPGAPLGLYWGRPWFLPLVAARYKLQDWIS